RARCLRVTGCCAAAWAAAAVSFAEAPDAATVLRARYAALAPALENSTIQKGLYVESVDDSRAPRGDAYAVVNYPFATVADAFRSPGVLCESLILHLNVQYCRANDSHEPPGLWLALGKKTHQALEDTYRIRLDFDAQTAGTDFM